MSLSDFLTFPSSEASSFPQLTYLFQSYFHQDFDIFGETLAEVIAVYRDESPLEDRLAMREEIGRFVAQFGPSSKTILAALERVFKPETMIEAWDGLDARQWLERVSELAVSPEEIAS